MNFNDGLVLVGLFLFWQCFHVFEVLKSNVRQGKSLGWTLPLDLALLAICAYGIYLSTGWLVAWISNIHTGFISVKYLGWLSGWLMVLPNAVLAFYYGWRKQPEVVYTSQVGDAHVSIPLCIGIYALYHTMVVPPFFHIGNVHPPRRDAGAPFLRHRFRTIAALRRLGAGRGLRCVPLQRIVGLKSFHNH